MDTTINIDFKYQLGLNPNLIEEQKLNDNDVEKIKKLHALRILIIEAAKAMGHTDFEHEDAQNLYKVFANTALQLQRTRKFEANPNYFKFWEFPLCECPTMDNNDNYPHGYYVMSGGCPIHGGNISNPDTDHMKSTITKEDVIKDIQNIFALRGLEMGQLLAVSPEVYRTEHMDAALFCNTSIWINDEEYGMMQVWRGDLDLSVDANTLVKISFDMDNASLLLYTEDQKPMEEKPYMTFKGFTDKRIK